jgi:uncharacterized membrane protein (DUF373 family)
MADDPQHNEKKDEASTQATSGLARRIRTSTFRFLEKADFIIYALVGFCFLAVAILCLAYCFWDFSTFFKASFSPALVGQSIIQLISNLLLVLIVMEVLGTVIHYLKQREISLRPFLYISIISATRSILSIGARLSLEGTSIGTSNFTLSMIELGVNGAVILALGITIRMIGDGTYED